MTQRLEFNRLVLSALFLFDQDIIEFVMTCILRVSGLRLNVFVASLVAGSLLSMSLSAQNARESSANVTPYFDDDIVIVEPEDATILNAFRVGGHQGRLRMGLPFDYADRAITHSMSTSEILPRRRGMMVKRSGYQLFMDLLTLGENKDIIGTDNLKKLYQNAKQPLRTDPFMAGWSVVLERAARGALSDEAYCEVFCVAEAPCPLDKFYGSRPYDITGLTPVWGAAYNEFRFRSAYQTFLDKYATALIDWGASLDRAAAVVTSVRLANYDFEKGAYVFRLGPAARMKAPEGGLHNVSTDAYDIEFHFRSEGGELSQILITWKLPRDKAEALREEMMSRKTNQLFALIDGELAFDDADRVGMNSPMMLETDTYVVLTGTAIQFYYDSKLTEELVSFELE